MAKTGVLHYPDLKKLPKAMPEPLDRDGRGGNVSRRDFALIAAAAATVAMAGSGSAATADGSDELAKLTMAEASKKIHAGEITCTELTRACVGQMPAQIPRELRQVGAISEFRRNDELPQ